MEGTVSLVNDEPSPLLVKEPVCSGVYFVTAEGYEVKTLMRNGFQGSATIRLTRSGGLRLVADETVLGFGKSFLMEVTSSDGSLAFEGSFGSNSTLLLQGLPAGGYGVTGSFPSTAVFGRTLLFSKGVVVEPGRVVELPVDYDPLISQEGFDATVVLPTTGTERSKWSIDVYRVTPVDEYVEEYSGTLANWQESEGSRTAIKSFDGLQEGVYRLIVQPSGRMEEVELRNGVRGNVLFELSDLAEVQVSCAGDAGDAEIMWGYVDSGGTPFRASLHKKWQAPNSGVFWCDSRPVHARLFGEDLVSDLVSVTPIAGETVELDLVPRRGQLGKLEVGIWSGGGHAYASGPSSWRSLTIEPLSGSGFLVANKYGSGSTSAKYGKSLVGPDWSQVQLIVSPPGMYRVFVPQVSKSFETWIGPEGGRLEVPVD